jgi:hypothetical protein
VTMLILFMDQIKPGAKFQVRGPSKDGGPGLWFSLLRHFTAGCTAR